VSLRDNSGIKRGRIPAIARRGGDSFSLRKQIMMQTNDIRRRPDGSLDIEFYRARAHTLRAQAMCDALRRVAAFQPTWITLALGIGTIVAASGSAHRL
jgi:hypothetical protein